MMASAFVNHVSFEFRTGLRNRALLLMNYLLPLGFYAMMGLLMAEINPLFREVMIPAMVVFAILSGALLGLPDPLVTSREAGIFRSYRVNGVPATSLLVIPALTTMLHMTIVATIITVTAPVLFSAPVPINWPSFVLTFLLMAFACTAIGMLIGVISASSRVTVMWSQLIYLPSMMLGGMMVPASMLPDTLRQVGLILPASHAMYAFQDLAYRMSIGFDPLWPVVVLLSGGLIAFGLAIYLFSWDTHNETRRGQPALAALALLPYVAAVFLLG